MTHIALVIMVIASNHAVGDAGVAISQVARFGTMERCIAAGQKLANDWMKDSSRTSFACVEGVQ